MRALTVPIAEQPFNWNDPITNNPISNHINSHTSNHINSHTSNHISNHTSSTNPSSTNPSHIPHHTHIRRHQVTCHMTTPWA